MFTTTTTNTLVVNQNGTWRVEVDRVACTPREYDEVVVDLSSGITSNPIGPYSGAAGDCFPTFDLTSYLTALMAPNNPANYTYEYYDLSDGSLIPDPTNFTPTSTTQVIIKITQGICETYSDAIDIIVDCVPATCSLTLTSAATTTTQSVCLNQAITNILYTAGGTATGVTLSSGAFPTGITGNFVSGVYTISGTPTQLGNFNYTIETVGCATNIQLSGTIIVNDVPSLTSLTSNTPICSGDNAVFSLVGTPNSTVTYTLNGNATPILTVVLDASGNGTVTISNATTNNTINLSDIAIGSCNAALSNTETVVIQAQPNAGTNGTLTVCQGTTPTNAQLFAQLGGTPAVTGTWTNVGLVYTYTVPATAPCTVNPAATVTVTEQVQPNAGTNGTLTVCQGTTPTNAQLFAQLGGTPDATGTWSNTGLVYTYTVNATAPCTGSATATVTVTEQVQPNAGTNGTLTVCQGTTPTNAQLFAQLGGTPEATGTWSNTGLVYTYTVLATAPCTVNATATVTVTEQVQPNAGTNGTLTVCQGTTPTNAQLFAQLGGTPDATGTWTNVGLVYTYTVNATAPCTGSATATVTVTEQVQPNAGTNGTLTVCQGTTPTNAQLFAQLGGTPDATGTWSNTGLVYTYTVNAIAPCTGSVTATVTVTEQVQPNAGTNGTLTVCQGTTPTNAQLFAQLGGTPEATGTWSNSGLVYTYTVLATAPCTVNATATVTVTEQVQPNAGTNGTLTVCQGTTPTNAQLFAQLGGTPDATGTWSNTGLVYTYTVNAIAPCTGSVTATVTVTEQVQPNAGTNGTLTVCQGTTPTNAQLFAQLGGAPEATGTWSNTGLVYTYTVLATAPCTVNATATVTVTEQVQPNAGTNGTLTVCQGTTPTNAQLFAQLGGTPDATGTWTNVGLVYTYTVNATAPCTGSATATVTVTEQVQPNAGTNGTLTVCQGTTPTNAQLFAQLGGTPDATGTWSNTGLVYTYTVNAIAPCTGSVTATVTVTEQVQPNAGTNGTLTVCQGTTPTNAQLFAQLGGTPEATGTWSNSGLVYTYTVLATAPCTVNATATVTVTEQVQPNAGTNGTLTVCQGTTPTNAQLFAQLGGTPDATGTWSNTGLVYTYTVNAIAPCTGSVTATVTVTEQVQPNAGTNGTLTVCQGTTPTNAQLFAQLGGTPEATGTWSNTGLVYTYTVLATAPCTVNATATVTVTEQVQPNAGTNGILTVCQGTTPTNAQLFAQLGGTPDATGTWSNTGLVYTYTVNAIAPCTGSATATVTVTEQIITASFSSTNSSACSGSSIALDFIGTPNSTVYFTDGTNNYNILLNATGIGQFNTAPLNSTTTFTLTNVISASPYNCNETLNQFLTITISPRPMVSFVNNTPTICSGSSTDIILTSNVPGATFSWNAVGANVSGSSNGTGTLISQLLSTTSNLVGEVVYTVVATANGCSGTPVEVRVNINPIPDVVATPTVDTICSGTQTNISFSGSIAGTIFNWTVSQSGVIGATSGTGTSIQQVLSTTSLTASGTAVYTVTPVLNGCSGTPVDVTITVNPTPEILGNPTHLPICSEESTNINVSAMDPATVFNFTVNAVGVTGATNGTITGNVIAQVLTTITNVQGYVDYTIVPTLNNCSGTPIIIRVIVNPLPLPVLEDGAICVDSSGSTFQSYYFHTGLNNATHTFVWYYEGVIIAGATSTSYEAEDAGSYSVIATNTLTGCPSKEVFGTVIETNPATSFTTTVTNAFTDNATIVVNVPDGNGTIMYQIDDEELQSSNIFTGVSAGIHTITVVDTQGCTYLTQTVTVIDYPKYFTPNGDGINDNWNIISLKNQPGAKLYIFDRYGKLIKQISTTSNGWDGTFNGQLLPSTDYWFTIEFDEGGQQRTFRAHFSLIR